MCKIILIPNARNTSQFKGFDQKMASLLSDQRDGFGYAVLGEKGVYGVRTLYPHAFASKTSVPEYVESHIFNFGEVSTINGAAMYHGRVSTNQKTLLNTHPIEREGWQLIHNGVVTNHGPKYAMNTNNDSEHVLYLLQNGGIKEVAKHLTGYYAFGAIDPEGQFHVARDGTANLFYAFSEKLNSPVFATTADLIESIGRFIDESFNIFKMKDNQYLVFDSSGELLYREEFKSRGWDTYSSSMSGKSLGWQLSPTNKELSYENWWSNPYNDTYDSEDIGTYTRDEPNEDTDLTGMLDEIHPDYENEIKKIDDTYTVKFRDEIISLSEFKSLPFDCKVYCTVFRKDGTIVQAFIDSEGEVH